MKDEMTKDEIQEAMWLEHDLRRFDDVFEVSEDNVYKRISKTKSKKYQIEFNDALNYLNENIEYDYDEIENWKCCDRKLQGEDSEDCIEMCICGKEIRYLYFIESNTAIVQVGSCCVKRASRDLYDHLTKSHCELCGGIIESMRPQYAKDGFCSKLCLQANRCKYWKCYLYDTTYGELNIGQAKAYLSRMGYSINPLLKIYLSHRSK